MNNSAGQSAIDGVVREIERMGSQAHLSRGQFRTVIGAVGEEGVLDPNHLAALEGVEEVLPIMSPYKLASREFNQDDSVVEIGGGSVPTVKSGRQSRRLHGRTVRGRESQDARSHRPVCSRRRRDDSARRRVQAAHLGRTPFKATAKRRSNGCAAPAMELGMPIVTEVMDTRQVELIERYTDMFQIGATQHAELRSAPRSRRTRKAVLLKRGLAATVKDWLLSASTC